MGIQHSICSNIERGRRKRVNRTYDNDKLDNVEIDPNTASAFAYFIGIDPKIVRSGTNDVIYTNFHRQYSSRSDSSNSFHTAMEAEEVEEEDQAFNNHSNQVKVSPVFSHYDYDHVEEKKDSSHVIPEVSYSFVSTDFPTTYRPQNQLTGPTNSTNKDVTSNVNSGNDHIVDDEDINIFCGIQTNLSNRNKTNSQSSPSLSRAAGSFLNFQHCFAANESYDSDSLSDYSNISHEDNGVDRNSQKSRKREKRRLKKVTSYSGCAPNQHYTPLLNVKSFGSLGNLIGYIPPVEYTDEEILMVNGDTPTEASDLRPKLQSKVISDGSSIMISRCRSFHVITTAALPWMTGTAVNPLLRAAYLNKMNRTFMEKAKSMNSETRQQMDDPNSENFQSENKMGSVTLVIPWLIEESDRKTLYGNITFESSADQEAYIRKWLRETANLPIESDEKQNGIKICFYPARYHPYQCSIFAMGDICSLIPDDKADVCILEEPEHLNWFRPVDTHSWPQKFNYVVGIIHTNYKAYAREQTFGIVISPVLESVSSIMVRAYCHKIIKLSGTLQTFASAKEVVSNTHGIRSEFLVEGERRGDIIRKLMHQSDFDVDKVKSKVPGKVYFIGKLLWAKGLDKLLDLEDLFKKKTGEYFSINVYGSGPDEVEIQRAFRGRRLKPNNIPGIKNNIVDETDDDDSEKSVSAEKENKLQLSKIEIPKSRYEWRRTPIPATFPGRIDHALLREEFKIFVNPSVTEVLCTTTAEALAMGKFVIIPQHPSNEFFEQFPNCLVYRSKSEFISHLQYAFEYEPTPLTDEFAHKLTWEAATERLMDSSIITNRDAKRRERLGETKTDERAEKFLHDTLRGTKGDFVRTYIFGGGRTFGEQFQYSTKASENQSQIEKVFPF